MHLCCLPRVDPANTNTERLATLNTELVLNDKIQQMESPVLTLPRKPLQLGQSTWYKSGVRRYGTCRRECSYVPRGTERGLLQMLEVNDLCYFKHMKSKKAL
jgi:hypothetical protein